MKIVTTLLSAALDRGRVDRRDGAVRRPGGGSGSDVNPNQMGRGADANPSGLNADPMAGNHGNTTQAGPRPDDGLRWQHGRHDLVQRVGPVDRPEHDHPPR